MAVAIEELLKSVMKMLYQNFWMKGELMMVRDVMKRDVKMADSLIFLKCMKSSPNPITVKIALMMNRLLKKGCRVRFTGVEVLSTIRY